MRKLIIIPAYNESKNIKTLVDTLFKLNSDYHILVVDDNSPDGTAKIVKDLQNHDGRQRKEGLYPGPNVCLKDEQSWVDNPGEQ